MADEPTTKIEAVADSSFLIGVCFMEQAELLDQMFARIYVPPAVWEEVVVRGRGKPGADQVANLNCLFQQELQKRETVALLEVFLGTGEAETLALAQELACPLVLVDEIKARKAAQQAGIRVLGVVGLLLAAKKQGHILHIQPYLEKLLARGFRLSKALIERALQEAGEAKTGE